ncbi:MAG: hypothetical protein ABII06_08995 [Pseudomonadota bacterium]
MKCMKSHLFLFFLCSLLKMYLKHRMRTFQAFFHVNSDYAYWYGWAAMVEDLGKIRELAESMRAIHGKGK